MGKASELRRAKRRKSNRNALSSVFRWCHVHMFLKNADEIFRCFIANLVSDVGDGEIGVLEKYLGFFKPDLLENLGKGFTGGGFNQPGSIFRRIMEFVGNLCQSHRVKIILNILQ